MGIKIEVWGDRALFTRPETKVERLSYDVMTPSAARGILDAIYWHPGLRWVIDSIKVCNPIRFASIKRNEIKHKINCNKAKSVMDKNEGLLYSDSVDDISQRNTTLLTNVRYVITAHFDMTDKAAPSDNPGKFLDIMRRRLNKGQCYHQPCFGCREYPAYFREITDDDIPVSDELIGEKDLGLMLYDLDYSNAEDIKPMYYRAKMTDGLIIVPARDSKEVYR